MPYLVGDIYITTRSENPSSLWQGTTWEKVGSGRALMGADSTHGVGTTVDSGLSDIQGAHKIGWGDKSGGGAIISSNSTTGAFYSARDGSAIFSAGTYTNRLVTIIEIRLVLKLVIIILSMVKAPQSNLLLSSVIFGND